MKWLIFINVDFGRTTRPQSPPLLLRHWAALHGPQHGAHRPTTTAWRRECPSTCNSKSAADVEHCQNPEFHSRSSPYRRTESMAEPRCHYHRDCECSRGHLRVTVTNGRTHQLTVQSAHSWRSSPEATEPRFVTDANGCRLVLRDPHLPTACKRS